jgi:peptide/nickel transport system substrate-binding protein
MRHSVAIALACVTLVGCTKTGPSVLVGGRHPWTIPHVLRIAEMSDPDRLNPYLSEMGVSYDLSSLVYSYLVIADNRGRLIGDLASTVPSLANGGISRDGRTYVYRLRQNVLWQDGVPFTARDVVASWEAVMNPRNNTFEREGYDRVASIEAAGPTTVMVRLRKRYPPFISRFFTPLQEGAKPVLPAHVLEREHNFNTGELAYHPVGTGPFRFISWVRGDRIVLRRFDRYFKGRPRLAQIEMRFIPDAQTTAAELETHQIDLIAVPQNSLDQYRSVEGVVVETGAPTNGQSLLLINVSKPTLRGLAVRRAIAAAVPYGAILHDVDHDLASEARNVLPSTAIGYEALRPRKYDPAAARDILERAGWRCGPDGVRTRNGVRLAFTLAIVAGFTSFGQEALLLQSSLKTVGVELAIKTYSYRTMFAAPNGPLYEGSYDLALSGGLLNWDPDLYNLLACDRWYPRGQNIYRFCDPRLDALERSGLQTDDPSRRALIYRRASRLIWSEIPYVPLFRGRALTVRSADLRNYSVNPTGGWNAWQWDI